MCFSSDGVSLLPLLHLPSRAFSHMWEWKAFTWKMIFPREKHKREQSYELSRRKANNLCLSFRWFAYKHSSRVHHLLQFCNVHKIIKFIWFSRKCVKKLSFSCTDMTKTGRSHIKMNMWSPTDLACSFINSSNFILFLRKCVKTLKSIKTFFAAHRLLALKQRAFVKDLV